MNLLLHSRVLTAANPFEMGAGIAGRFARSITFCVFWGGLWRSEQG